MNRPVLPLLPRTLRRPLGATFATSLASQGLNAASGIMLARRLDPAHRGELVAVLLWPTLLAMVGALGVDAAGTFHAARGTTDVGTLVGSMIALCAIQSVALVALGGAVIPFALSHHDAAAHTSAYLYLSYIPLGMSSLYLMSVLNGLQHFTAVNLVRFTVIGLSSIGIAVLFVTASLTVRNAVLVYLGANISSLLMAAASFRSIERQFSLSFSAPLARSLLAFGIRSHTSTVSSYLNERLDQLLISLFLAPARLGLYVIAVTVTSLTTLVGSSVAIIAFPRIACLDSRGEQRIAARRYLGLTVLGSLMLTAPIIALAPFLIRHLFGAPYGGASNVARVLLVAAVVLSVNRVLSAVAKAANRPMDAGIAEFVALGVTLVGLAVMLPLLGIMGAAIASLLAYGVSAAWLAVRIGRAFEVPVVSLFLGRSEAAFGRISGVRVFRVREP